MSKELTEEKAKAYFEASVVRHCPYCFSDNAKNKIGPFVSSRDYCIQDMLCDKCGGTWREGYRLEFITDEADNTFTDKATKHEPQVKCSWCDEHSPISRTVSQTVCPDDAGDAYTIRLCQDCIKLMAADLGVTSG